MADNMEILCGMIPVEIGEMQASVGRFIKTHPIFEPIEEIHDPVLLALNKQEPGPPTALRTLAIPETGKTGLRVYKGYYPSPVRGNRANVNRSSWLEFFAGQGEFGGRATEDDYLRELTVQRLLLEVVPDAVLDPHSPIWQLTGVAFTGEKLQIWRDDDRRPRKGVIIERRMPFTQWRCSDAFFPEEADRVEWELDRLQAIWNVTDRAGVYLKAIKRLGKAMGYLWDAQIVHGNLYWRWSNSAGYTYSRVNVHNIGFDGSVGDFEIIDERYGQEEKDVFLRELLGALAIYGLFVAKQGNNLLSDSGFVQSFVHHFLRLFRMI